MRAWRVYGFGDLRLDELPDPEPGPGEALVRPLVVQPSVAEAILAFGGETFGRELIREALEHAPVQLFGHEYCAEVVAVGPGVEELEPGVRVADVASLPYLEGRGRSVDLCFPPLGARRHLARAAELAAAGAFVPDSHASHAVEGLERVPEAFAITADKARHGALGPCQVLLGGRRA